MFQNRKFVIIPADKISQVDFSQVMESSPDTCRYSVDRSKTFVKYEGDMPSSVASIEGISQEYLYGDFLQILSSSEWVAPNPITGE
jgi:hypothetical protein